MKDPNDMVTLDCVEGPEQAGAAIAPEGQRRPAARPELRSVNSFKLQGSVTDDKTAWADKPKGAKPALVAYRMMPSYFVPVSFAAKDWNVTPRRIRALLAAGRLAGQLKDNGYWEVLYPYSFTFGTRGPSLKRQQRPPAKPKKSELRTE